MGELSSDIRYTLRSLRKNPGFALLAVLALALGIGANTAIFSVVYSLMFRPLQGAKNAGELVSIVLTEGTFPYGLSYPVFDDYRSLNKIFTDAAGYEIADGQIRVGQEPAERVMPTLVTENFFDLLGVRMEYGRSFSHTELSSAATSNVVILSHRFWKKRFAGNSSAVGSVIRVNGNAFTIIGIASPEFTGPSILFEHKIYVPVAAADMIAPGYSAFKIKRLRAGEVNFIGRLRPGVSLKAAQAAANVVASRLANEFPDIHKGQRVMVLPEPRTRMEPSAVGFLPPIAIIFMSLVGLVLLAACANVASLLYARASSRQKEIAIRMALGARRFRLLRQFLTESLILSLIGAAAGLLLARWINFQLSNIKIATDIPLDFHFTLDTTVMLYSLVLAVLSGLLAGVMPALRASGTYIASTLKEGGQSSVRGSARQRLRDALVVLQVAVSVVLLVCAGLFLRSTANAAHQDIGIRTENRLVMAMDTEMIKYDKARSQAFYRDLLSRVRNIPGVESAALASFLPIGFRNGVEEVLVEGRAVNNQSPDRGFINIVTPEYFATIGMPVLQGRSFRDTDDAQSKKVAIINQAMAERYWPHEDPMGKRFRVREMDTDPVEVIGVVTTAKYTLPAERPQPAFYLPFDQRYRSDMVLHVHTKQNPREMIPVVRKAISDTNPDMPVWDVRTLEEHIRFGKMRLYDIGTGLIGGFGLIALALAAVGLYGIMAFMVQQRTHEIGVRMALGATRGSLLKTVISSGLLKTAIGLALGLPIAFLATRGIQYLLLGVSPKDPFTFLSACAFLTTITLIASLVPAWRATRVDPLIALRAD